MPTPARPDPIRSPDAALIERVVLLRSALESLTSDHADMHRKLARARAENETLRAALSRSGDTFQPLASAQGPAAKGAP
jgi:hypothetical protein